MSKPDYAAIEEAIVKEQLTSGLREKLDTKFRRLLELAEAEWDRNFAGEDPSDASVSVRISSRAPRAGFLAKSSPPRLRGSGQRRLA